jgi:hypothetical protein
VSCTTTYGIRARSLLLTPLLPVSSAFLAPRPRPKAALNRFEETKFDEYSEGVRSHPDTRFIPFVVIKFGALGGHATAFSTELARHATASKGMQNCKYATKKLAS